MKLLSTVTRIERFSQTAEGSDHTNARIASAPLWQCREHNETTVYRMREPCLIR